VYSRKEGVARTFAGTGRRISWREQGDALIEPEWEALVVLRVDRRQPFRYALERPTTGKERVVRHPEGWVCQSSWSGQRVTRRFLVN
jgi:hypothetical protein